MTPASSALLKPNIRSPENPLDKKYNVKSLDFFRKIESLRNRREFVRWMHIEVGEFPQWLSVDQKVRTISSCLFPKSRRPQNTRKASDATQSKMKFLGASGEPLVRVPTQRLKHLESGVSYKTAIQKHPPKKQVIRKVKVLFFDHNCSSGPFFFWLVLPTFRVLPP